MEPGDSEVQRYMDGQLYKAAREGNEDYLDGIGVSSPEVGNGEVTHDEHYFLMQTPNGDNVLHLAASRDRLSFIVKVLERIPAVVLLICWSNSHGENPLHVAARLGHLEIVQVLVTSYKCHLQNVKERKVRSTLLSLMVAEPGTESPEPWMAQDSRGNTSLHEALKNGYEEVGMYLLEVEPKLACYDNNGDESTLFLAAAYGHENVLEMILTSEEPYSLSSPLGLTPLHAATHNCTEGAAKLLLEKQPQLAKKADIHKKTALHYAAEANKDGHVEAILRQEKSCAYLRDDKGLTPILRAASLGQLQAVHAILLHCPQTVAMSDNDGKTVLHLIDLKSYQDGIELLKIPVLGKLINEQDLEGNTPLHLAVKKSEHVKAKVLLDTDKTGLTLRNKGGFTAWDLIKLQPELSEDMAEIGYQLILHTSNKQIKSEHQPQVINQTAIHPEDSSERLQRKFNTLGLIAAVLAAVTFAAGFIIPGGLDRSGHAFLAKQTDFKVFILSNTTAMGGYTLVLLSALWAMMITRRDDEPRFLLSFSIHVLQLSFYASLIAFVSSMYALISAKTLWVAIVVVCLPPCIVILTISKSVVFRLAKFFSRCRGY